MANGVAIILGNKADNRPSNLWIFPNQEEHENVH
jgi:hypothetical protein